MRLLLIMLIDVLAMSALTRVQSLQEDWKQCVSSNPQISIVACSALIQSGQATTKGLAYAFDNRGLAYARTRNFDRAIQDYNEALRLSPNSATAHYNRGVAYEFKGDYEKAFPDLDQAVRLTPRDADSYFCRGLVFERRGDYEHAIQDYDQVLRLNPTYSAAFHNRALSYAHERSYLRALADYGRWRRLKSGNLAILQLCVALVMFCFAVGFLWRTTRSRSYVTSLFSAETASPDISKVDLIDQP